MWQLSNCAIHHIINQQLNQIITLKQCNKYFSTRLWWQDINDVMRNNETLPNCTQPKTYWFNRLTVLCQFYCLLIMNTTECIQFWFHFIDELSAFVLNAFPVAVYGYTIHRIFLNLIQYVMCIIPSIVIVHFKSNSIHQLQNSNCCQEIVVCMRKTRHAKLFLDYWIGILNINVCFWLNLTAESKKKSILINLPQKIKIWAPRLSIII